MGRHLALSVAVVAAAWLAGTAQGQEKPKLPFTVSKEATAITSPLRVDGTPDYVAALNEKYGKGVTPENNGFVVWLKVVGTGDGVIDPKDKTQVLKLCGAKETPVGEGVWATYTDFLKSKGEKTTGPLAGLKVEGAPEEPLSIGPRAYPWKAKEHPLPAEYLKARETQLALVPEIVRREKWWEPAISSDTRYTPLGGFRGWDIMKEITFSLQARAMMRLGEEDFDGFLNDITMEELLARKARFPSIAFFVLGRSLGKGNFTEKQCRAIHQAVNAVPERRSWAEEMDTTYRWNILQLVIFISQGKGASLPANQPKDPYPLFAALKKVKPEQVDFDQVLRLVNQDMDEIVAALNESHWGEGQVKLKSLRDRLTKSARLLQLADMNLAKRSGETREAYSRRFGESIMGSLGEPILGIGFDLIESTTTERTLDLQREQMWVLSAVAEWKAHTGEWPDDLGRLVPRYLKKIPVDPYSPGGAEMMRYKATVDGAQIYSVGPDGEDEGGIPSRDNKYQGDDFGVGMP